MNVAVDEDYLVDQARKGFLGAFETLVERYGPLVYRVAMRMVNDEHGARTITQDAFVVVWRTLPGLGRDASFATLLYTVVTREAVYFDTRSGRGRNATLPHAKPPENRDPAGSARRQQAVDTAVAALPPAQRVAMVLHHFEGLSYADVASITATSVPAVRSHLFRARRTLVTTLGQMEVST